MDKNKELRSAIKAAYNANNKLDCAVQKVESLLRFEGFSFTEAPNACICAGGEFILEYRRQINISISRVKRTPAASMQLRGLIVPESEDGDDFDGKSKKICNFTKNFQEKFCGLNKIY